MSIRYRALLLRRGHELGQVVHRQGRVDEQRLGTVVDDGDGLEIESQILVEMRIDGERRAQNEKQRVTVRRRPADEVSRNITARAGARFDHHGLFQARSQFVRNRSTDDVQRSAGCR